jgi:group I intron endonuclease
MGSTAQAFEVRWKKHREHLMAGSHANRHLQASWTKHGEASFKFWVAEETTPEQAVIREQWWLDVFVFASEFTGKRYNICPVAGSCRGRRVSNETRGKIALAHIGMKQADESRRKIALAQMGRPRSEETKAKLRIAFSGKNHPGFGKPRKPETIQRMSESHLGKPWSTIRRAAFEKKRNQC